MLDKNITNPGIHKQFLFTKFSEEEQAILRNLSKSWYLTNSGETIRAAQSSYKYFLMKPIKRTSEMFNIEREIICVFSDYPNFEPRSLDIFDAVISSLPKMRTETVCEILISRAKDVETKVDRLLKSDPEHPIVIPFTYDELSFGKIEHSVLNRFRSHFYSRDLFSFLSPLKKDTYFFGRTNILNEIVGRYRSGEHTSLFGLRKSGKTSIVYALERRLQSEGEDVLSLDCESPSVHLSRWYELLEKIVNRYKILKKSNVNLSPSSAYDEKNAAESFEKDMLAIYAKSPSSNLFVFDEIERITPGTASSKHWKDEVDFIYFWQTLRGFYQKHPGVFCYMLVGTNPSCIESPIVAGHENPIYASIPSQYVPPFTVEQVTQMVSRLGDYMGLKFDPLLYGKLTEDFGGHPFLIRQMCSLINKKASNNRPVYVDKALYTKVKNEFSDSSFNYMEMMVHVLKEWYPDEYDMLRFLAQGDLESFNSFAENHGNYTRHLVGYGLVQASQNGYTFNLESLADVVRKNHAYEKLNLNQEEKIQEVSLRRSRIEKKMRLLIKNCLRISFGMKGATDKVFSALTADRRQRLLKEDLTTLLDKDRSPLFFLELISIIRREWNAFENILGVDKTKFLIMLDDINTHGRPDAHAKSISADDFTQLRLYFKKIEDIFSEIEM